MTRQQIKAAVNDLIQAHFGTPAEHASLGFDNVVTQAANDVAQRTNCLFTTATGNLANGTSDYSPSPIYAIKRVEVGDGSGNLVRLEPIVLDDVNRWGPTLGLLNTNGTYAFGIPSYYLPISPGTIRIITVPNYSLTSGLTVEGFGYPSALWPNQTDACPLPVDAHMAVVYRAAVLRAAQFPSNENAARVAGWERAFAFEASQVKSVLDQHVQMEAAKGREAGGGGFAPYT